jgi:hypothetical protein
MSEHYPRIRIYAQSGYLLIRESLSLCFSIRRPHLEVAPAVMRSLEAYLRAVGPEALSLYADEEGEWRELNDAGWEYTRRELLDDRLTRTLLMDRSTNGKRYGFEYYGQRLDTVPRKEEADTVCLVCFWLPTEYLEEHGPNRVRELALELAAPLPFCSGNAGLAFNAEIDLLGVLREIRRWCFRYPGLDIPDQERLAWEIGTRIRGPSWLTFLGQPVLEELGGAAGLRSQLHSEGTTVQQMEGERAIVTLGPWPEAGDTEQGLVLPAYRELARVLEPWLYHRSRDYCFDAPEDSRRWERRFLD